MTTTTTYPNLSEYYFHAGIKTFAEAKVVCNGLEKKLLEPISSQINNIVTQLAQSQGIFRFWIGVNDIANEGTFVYDSSGTIIVYANWNPGEPSDSGGEDCTEINNGNWNDMPCTYNLPFVCSTTTTNPNLDGSYISEIRITTDTVDYADSSDAIQIQICQSHFCCQTLTFPGIYAIGTTEIFSGSQLGECWTVAINTNESINVTLNTISIDGWKGTIATIHTVSNHQNVYYQCSITSWLDSGSGANGPDNFETTCTTIAGNDAGLITKIRKVY